MRAPGPSLDGDSSGAHLTLHRAGEAVGGRVSLGGLDAEPEHSPEGACAREPKPAKRVMAGGHIVESGAQGRHSVRFHLAQECQGHVPAFTGYPTHVRGGGGDPVRTVRGGLAGPPVNSPGSVGKRLGAGADADEEAHLPRLCRDSDPLGERGAAYHGVTTEQRG